MAQQYTNATTLPKATGNNTAIAAKRIVRVNSSGQFELASTAADDDAVGVTEVAVTNDTRTVSVNLFNVSGILEIQPGAAITVGAKITNDVQGRAVSTTTSDAPYFGIALGAATDANSDPIEVLIVSGQKV